MACVETETGRAYRAHVKALSERDRYKLASSVRARLMADDAEFARLDARLDRLATYIKRADDETYRLDSIACLWDNRAQAEPDDWLGWIREERHKLRARWAREKCDAFRRFISRCRATQRDLINELNGRINWEGERLHSSGLL